MAIENRIIPRFFSISQSMLKNRHGFGLLLSKLPKIQAKVFYSNYFPRSKNEIEKECERKRIKHWHNNGDGSFHNNRLWNERRKWNKRKWETIRALELYANKQNERWEKKIVLEQRKKFERIYWRKRKEINNFFLS